MKKALGFFLVAMLFLSCSNIRGNRVIRLANKDLDTKLLLIEEILIDYGVESFSVFGTAHFQYTSNEISKQLIKDSFSGTGFTPEGPPGSEVPPSYQERSQEADDSNLISRYEHSDLVVNYDNEIGDQVYLERFSFLIMVKNLDSQDLSMLEEAMGEFILSESRGDILTIIGN